MAHPIAVAPRAVPVAPRMRTASTSAMTIEEFVLPPECPVPAHEHTPPHILIVLNGALFERDGDGETICVAGAMRYSPARDRHVVRISAAGAHCLVLEAHGFPELMPRRHLYLSPMAAADPVSRVRQLFDSASLSPARAEDVALSLFGFMRESSKPAGQRRGELDSRRSSSARRDGGVRGATRRGGAGGGSQPGPCRARLSRDARRVGA